MNIPLVNTKEDIYSLGFGKDLSREIPDNSTGVVYDTIENAINTGSVLSGGNLNVKTLTIGGLTRQVAPGDDIQAAIDAINREGGGTVQLLAKTYSLRADINLRDNVAIVGAGRDVTFLDFEGRNFSIYIKGTSVSQVKNTSIRDLTVANSQGIGIDFDFADFFEIRNIRTTTCGLHGIRLQRCQNFSFANVRSDTNSSSGFYIFSTSSSGRYMRYFTFTNLTSDSNGDIGFFFDVSANVNCQVRDFVVTNCTATGNAGDGFDITESGSSSFEEISSFVGCQSIGNSGKGFDINGGTSRAFVALIARDNGSDGFEVNGDNMCTFHACVSIDNNINWDVTSSASNFIGCVFDNTIAPNTNFAVPATSILNIVGTQNGGVVHDRQVFYSSNNSGGTIPEGAVMIYDPAAPTTGMTTTTTNGDKRVFSMSLGNATVGQVTSYLSKGTAISLLVSNGTSSITIGDYLSTYSHAYYAKKATAGEMAFAIALSTPSGGTASIGALLISPRLV